MTLAALALAAAVLVRPDSSRRRVRSLRLPAAPRRRLPRSLLLAGAGAALSFVLPVPVLLAGALLAVTVYRRRRAARDRAGRSQDSAALQDALDVLVGELRIGAHPVAALGAAAGEAHGRVARSLSVVTARAALGGDVAAGLHIEATRAAAPGQWTRLAVCWQLATDHGLAIATVVRAAQQDIGEREKFHRGVEAGMAGARATAVILAGLPALGVLLGLAIGADPVGFLLAGGVGTWLLLVGTALICCGLLWSDRITAQVLS